MKSIHTFVAQADLSIIQQIVSNDRNQLEYKDEKYFQTPLLAACKRNLTNITMWLLSNNADINATDKWKNSALHYASRNENIQLINELIFTHRCEIKLKNNLGQNSLMYAILHGSNDQVIELLLSQYQMELSATDVNNWSIFHLAADKYNLQVFRYCFVDNIELKDHAVKICNQGDKDGWTVLHIAACFGHIDICRMLVAAATGARCVNLLSNRKETPLMLSSSTNQLETTHFLISNGADIELQDVDGDTALILASREGLASMVTLLTDKGASRLTSNVKGQTAIDVAMERHLPEVIVILHSFDNANFQETVDGAATSSSKQTANKSKQDKKQNRKSTFSMSNQIA